MVKTALIRADASPQIGGGHVVRTLALGTALAEAGFKLIFATRAETLSTVPFLKNYPVEILTVPYPLRDEAAYLEEQLNATIELLVVDHYGLGIDFEAASRSFARNILVLDDIPNRQHNCDFLLDQTWGRTPGEYSGMVPKDCRLLLGTEYALLRWQFRRAKAELQEKPRQELKRLLIMLGAGDSIGLTGRIVESLSHLRHPLTVDLVGPEPPRLPSHGQNH